MRTSFWLCALLMVGIVAVGCETDGDGDDKCLTSTPCVDNSDCDSGQHCNTALATPMCQVLYCGEAGTQCSEDELCVARVCDGDLCAEPECVPDCGSAECGLDPVCGMQNCGTCGDGKICRSGQCKTDTGWEPDEYTVNCGADGMCFVPEGPFWMGCNQEVDEDCLSDEFPYHEVTLSGYYMDKTEVTVAHYEECVTAGSCTAPSTYDSHCNWGVLGKGNHPVNCVHWTQAGGYCAWAGKRLPTEAEWEKAARGTDGRMFPWGNETATCDYAVMDDDGKGCGTDSTWEVCGKSPAGDSPYGFCDMAGNAWEWVSDWWDSGYYASTPASNPTGPDSGEYRIPRGGSFGFPWEAFDYLRASNRGSYYFPSEFLNYYPYIGFRCAKDAP